MLVEDFINTMKWSVPISVCGEQNSVFFFEKFSRDEKDKILERFGNWIINYWRVDEYPEIEINEIKMNTFDCITLEIQANKGV